MRTTLAVMAVLTGLSGKVFAGAGVHLVNWEEVGSTNYLGSVVAVSLSCGGIFTASGRCDVY